MSYSIETRTDDLSLRQGFYKTLDAAKRSIIRKDFHPGGAAIYEGEWTSGGRLVAVYAPDDGWIDAEAVEVPDWWDDVPQGVRDWLLENPGEILPARVWAWVVKAGGIVAGAHWVEGEGAAELRLSLADQEWVRFQRALGAAQ